MKKLFKYWWLLLLIAGYWIVKRAKRAPNNTETVLDPTPEQGPVLPETENPFQGGACLYGSPT